jgi:peptide deformylase
MTARRVLTMSELDRNMRTREVDGVDDVARELAADLIDTMRASPACVGIAAPQIGVSLRAFALDVSGHKKTTTCHGELVLFNPVIVSAESSITEREGCMSVPDLTGDVARAVAVIVDGIDCHGNAVRIESEGFEARALQHEIDHLDGLLFLDRLAGPGALHTRRVYR